MFMILRTMFRVYKENLRIEPVQKNCVIKIQYQGNVDCIFELLTNEHCYGYYKGLLEHLRNDSDLRRKKPLKRANSFIVLHNNAP